MELRWKLPFGKHITCTFERYFSWTSLCWQNISPNPHCWATVMWFDPEVKTCEKRCQTTITNLKYLPSNTILSEVENLFGDKNVRNLEMKFRHRSSTRTPNAKFLPILVVNTCQTFNTSYWFMIYGGSIIISRRCSSNQSFPLARKQSGRPSRSRIVGLEAFTWQNKQWFWLRLFTY